MGKRKENRKRPRRAQRLIRIGKITDVPCGRGARLILNDGSEVAVFNRDGQFYAVENFCPHKGRPLVDSNVDGNTIECPFHGWKFELGSGNCLTKRGSDIESYEVDVVGENVLVRI